MKPYFSIIVPYHNSVKTILPLLDSIKASKHIPPIEVIIVDDGSEKTLRMTNNELQKKLKRYTFPIQILVFAKNAGPAKARNRGAWKAKGRFLVFLDSDVELMPDALSNLWHIYIDDPDVVAVTGVWMKHQKTKAFFPNFKALRDWSYWINERDKSGYYYLFSTRIASIKREVFVRLQGFDETYDRPLVEDIEFTYRVARRYAIIFASNVRVRHEFEDFLPIAKKYFWRSYYWTKLYQERRHFDPVATTFQEAVTALTGCATFCAILLLWFLLLEAPILSFVFQWFPIVVYVWFITTIALATFHLIFVRTFLLFVREEKGWVFAIQSYIVGIILYFVIALGALWGRISSQSE